MSYAPESIKTSLDFLWGSRLKKDSERQACPRRALLPANDSAAHFRAIIMDTQVTPPHGILFSCSSAVMIQVYPVAFAERIRLKAVTD